MAEREAIYKLKFLVDKGGQQESVRAIDALSKEFTELDQNAQQVGTSAQLAVAKLTAFDKGRANLRAVADEAKNIAINSDAIGTALDRGIDRLRATADEAKDASISAQNLGQEMDATAQKIEKAKEASDDLGSSLKQASDIPNLTINRNLSSVRGIAQATGLGGAAQPLGAAGDVLELAEELPNLKLALQSMPDAVRAAASEIGAPGIGLIGGLALLAGAFALLAKVTEEEKNRKLGELKAAEEFSVFSATATYDEAVAKRQELETEIKRQQEQLIAVQKQLGEGDEKLRKNAQENLGGIFGDSAVTDALAKGFASAAQGLSDVGLGAGDIQALEQEADRLNSALNENITSFNLLTDGIVYGKFAANDAAKAIDTQAQATINFYQRQYDLQLEYQDLVADGSTEQLNQLLAQNKLETDTNRARIQGLFTQIEVFKQAGQAIPESLQSAFDNAVAASAELSSAQTYLTDTVQPLIAAREAEAKIIAETTTVLSEVAGKIAAASAEQQSITKERVAQIKEQAQAELEFTKFLRTATADNVAARVQALQDEADAIRSTLPELEELAPTSRAAAEELKAARERLDEINVVMAKLGSEGVIAAIQREQAELTAEIIKIESARNEKIIQLRAQAAAKEAELYQDLQQDLADATADANDERIEAQRDYQEKAVEIAEDLARKRLDIEKKYSRSAAQAIGDRDALALYQAKQTRDEGLEDAEDSAAQARADLQRNYAQQLDTINRELEKQRQTLNAKYAQQLADLRTQTQNAINLENQKAAQEIAVRQQAYQQELAQLNSFAVSGVGSIATFATNSLTTLAGFVTQAQAIMAGLSGNSPVYVPTVPGIPPITNRPPGAPGGPISDPGININIAGYTAEQIQAELNKVLKQLIPN